MWLAYEVYLKILSDVKYTEYSGYLTYKLPIITGN